MNRTEVKGLVLSGHMTEHFQHCSNNVFAIHTRNRKTQHFEGIKKKIATYFTLPTFLTFVIRNSSSLPTNLSIFLFYLKNYEILQLLHVVLDPNVFCFPSLFLIVSD